MRATLAFCVAAVLVPAAARPDTAPPSITAVTVAPPLVAAGDLVTVSVTATDDTAVTSVAADGVDLSFSAGQWSGEIPANAAPGTHSVTVMASDAAANSGSDSSASYTTTQILGIRNDTALEQALYQARSRYLYRVWGKAKILTRDSFSVDEGGRYPVRVMAPEHGVCNGDYVVARGILDPDAVPATVTYAQYLIVAPAPRTPINFGDVTVGKDLMTSLSGSLQANAPAGNLMVTLASADPTKVLLSNTHTQPGRASIAVQVNAGSNQVPYFFIHGLDQSGTVQIMATAPGCQGEEINVTLAPSGFRIGSSSPISTTTFSANTSITIVPVRLSPTLTPVSSQPLRPGVSAEVHVTSSDESVGAITASPLVISSGTQASTQFDPFKAGTTTIACSTPPGWVTPSTGTSVPVTVTDPNIYSSSAAVGLNLRKVSSFSFEASPPHPVDVTVTVADPTIALLSAAPNDAGSASLVFAGTASTGTPRSFYVHGLALGDTQVLIQAGGFRQSTPAVAVTPSGFSMTPSSINTSTFSTDSALTVRAARLHPDTNGLAEYQPLRSGVSASVSLSVGDPAVGTISPPVLSFSGGDASLSATFDPANPGVTAISLQQPAGWSIPSSGTFTSVTVTAPKVIWQTQLALGRNLQKVMSVRLPQSPPAPTDIVVTSSDPDKVVLSASPTAPGSISLTLAGVTNTIGRNVYVQALATGTATLTASANGYAGATTAVEVGASGFVIQSPSGDTSTFLYSVDTSVTVMAARLNSSGVVVEYGYVRPGLAPAEIPVTSSNTDVGIIKASPLVFGPNDGSKTTAFDPIALGAAVVAIAAPPGWDTPSSQQSRTITVLQPRIQAMDGRVGRHLQVAQTAQLDVKAPSPVTVTITTSDPNTVLLSKDPSAAGSASLTFPDVTGTRTGTYYVQGLKIGSPSLTVSAPGYLNGVAIVDVLPSGFVISSPGSITTTAGASNSAVHIAPAMLNPVTLNMEVAQAIRGGFSTEVSVISSNPAVGVIWPEILSFTATDFQETASFDPQGFGTTQISISASDVFSVPSNKQSITATVNP